MKSLQLDFDGYVYERKHDFVRLSGQLKVVKDLMSDEKWRTLREIEDLTGYTSASISARLRDLRKAKFGGYEVERRIRGDRSHGLFEYRVKRLSILP